ncbi:hypothetical protein ARSEF4850_002409 [Beauveria asiatica]
MKATSLVITCGALALAQRTALWVPDCGDEVLMLGTNVADEFKSLNTLSVEDVNTILAFNTYTVVYESTAPSGFRYDRGYLVKDSPPQQIVTTCTTPLSGIEDATRATPTGLSSTSTQAETGNATIAAVSRSSQVATATSCYTTGNDDHDNEGRGGSGILDCMEFSLRPLYSTTVREARVSQRCWYRLVFLLGVGFHIGFVQSGGVNDVFDAAAAEHRGYELTRRDAASLVRRRGGQDVDTTRPKTERRQAQHQCCAEMVNNSVTGTSYDAFIVNLSNDTVAPLEQHANRNSPTISIDRKRSTGGPFHHLTAIMTRPQKMVIVGAGPVGTLAALYAAQRGYAVESTYIRDPGVGSLSPGKSINLALSERGMNALRHAGQPELLQRVLDASVPMRGRMIHGKTVSGDLYEVSQDFDALGRTNFAIDRAALNANLLDCLDALPNVKLFFNHKLIHVDFHNCMALVEDRDWLSQSIEVKFDIMLGADGARSAVRYHMMNISRMDYQHEYLDDGSFTCTLFMPASRFAALEADESQILPFFDANFPGVRNHISDTSLIRSFSECPHRPLVSIKCKPYHFGSSSVIVGDAAHAMAPFYGQGMNAGMEHVRLLFSVLDKHAHATGAALRGEQGEDDKNNHSPSRAAKIRGRALAEYSASRWRDAHAIKDLAMQNYREMRTSQSTLYKLRKALEEFMHATFPSLGWQSKYSQVVFSNEPYAECVRRNDGQDRLLSIFTALCTGPLVAAGLYLARARGCLATALWSAVTAPWQWPGFWRHVLSVALGG